MYAWKGRQDIHEENQLFELVDLDTSGRVLRTEPFLSHCTLYHPPRQSHQFSPLQVRHSPETFQQPETPQTQCWQHGKCCWVGTGACIMALVGRGKDFSTDGRRQMEEDEADTIL